MSSIAKEPNIVDTLAALNQSLQQLAKDQQEIRNAVYRKPNRWQQLILFNNKLDFNATDDNEAKEATFTLFTNKKKTDVALTYINMVMLGRFSTLSDTFDVDYFKGKIFLPSFDIIPTFTWESSQSKGDENSFRLYPLTTPMNVILPRGDELKMTIKGKVENINNSIAFILTGGLTISEIPN